MKKYYLSTLLLSFNLSFLVVFAQAIDVNTSVRDSSCITINGNLSYRNRVYNNKEDVMALQGFLNGAGYLNTDSVTGFFGRLTEKAVAKFQKDNSLIANPVGFVGIGTRTKIKILSCKAENSLKTTSIKSDKRFNISISGLKNLGVLTAGKTYTLQVESEDGIKNENISFGMITVVNEGDKDSNTVSGQLLGGGKSTDRLLTFMIPENILVGKYFINLNNDSGSLYATSAKFLVVGPKGQSVIPVIDSISSYSVKSGDLVTLRGSNFYNGKILFDGLTLDDNDTQYSEIDLVRDSVTFRVPNGFSTTGSHSVQVVLKNSSSGDIISVSNKIMVNMISSYTDTTLEFIESPLVQTSIDKNKELVYLGLAIAKITAGDSPIKMSEIMKSPFALVDINNPSLTFSPKGSIYKVNEVLSNGDLNPLVGSDNDIIIQPKQSKVFGYVFTVNKKELIAGSYRFVPVEWSYSFPSGSVKKIPVMSYVNAKPSDTFFVEYSKGCTSFNGFSSYDGSSCAVK